jgi:hypothetical protein
MAKRPWLLPEELEFHPIANAFRLMEGEEFDALVADIKANGLKHGICLYEGKILDGRNRYRALQKLGIDPTEHLRYPPKDITDAEARAYVISQNVHRRHLTADQKRDAIAALIKAQPEKSDRALAGELKVGKDTVRRARKKAEATGAVAPVEKRTGKDGKARKQATRKAKSAHTDECNVILGSESEEHPQGLSKCCGAPFVAGNGADPEASAEARKAGYAAGGAIQTFVSRARRSIEDAAMEIKPANEDEKDEAATAANEAARAWTDAYCRIYRIENDSSPIEDAWDNADEKDREQFIDRYERDLRTALESVGRIREERQKAEREKAAAAKAQRLAKARAKGKTRKLTIAAAVADAFRTFADLSEQMAEWRDGMPDNLQGGSKYEAVSEVADALENLASERPNVPEAVADIEIEVPIIKCKSRADERDEATFVLQECVCALEDKGCAEFCSELGNVISEAECIEFPGAFG